MGQLGKKLHTGRSRNDQVATDLKLWCKDTVSELLTANRQLQSALVETAQNNQDAVMPGYTHLQRAHPVTFAHWCLAYVEMLARDESRLQDALKRLDVSPLPISDSMRMVCESFSMIWRHRYSPMTNAVNGQDERFAPLTAAASFNAPGINQCKCISLSG